MNPIENWKVGDRTIDDDGHIGTIIEIEDIHNVHVALDNNGRAIYCCYSECEAYFPCRLYTP
jgi:hypothetical protein